jgi:MFS family permease
LHPPTAFVSAIFNIFWTATPLLLADCFGFSPNRYRGLCPRWRCRRAHSPLAGRLGDRGYIRLGTGIALASMTASCLLAGAAGQTHSLLLLVMFALTLDGATRLGQVLGQRVIFFVPGKDRGRDNAVYMTIVFLLGSCGPAIATLSYHVAGWWGAMDAGAILGIAVSLLFATEFLEKRTDPTC